MSGNTGGSFHVCKLPPATTTKWWGLKLKNKPKSTLPHARTIFQSFWILKKKVKGRGRCGTFWTPCIFDLNMNLKIPLQGINKFNTIHLTSEVIFSVTRREGESAVFLFGLRTSKGKNTSELYVNGVSTNLICIVESKCWQNKISPNLSNYICIPDAQERWKKMFSLWNHCTMQYFLPTCHLFSCLPAVLSERR